MSNSRPFGVEVRPINGKLYAIWRNRLQDEMYPDTDANPILWFAKEIETQDMLVCGLKTKREAIEHLEAQ